MGNPYIAANSRLAYGSETTFGTRAATIAKSFGHFRGDISFPDAKLEVRKYYTFGVGREWKRIQPGKIDRTGKFPIVPTNAELFGYLWGKDTFSSPTHTLEPGLRAILPSLSAAALLVDDAAAREFQRAFLGTILEEGNFTVAKEEELQADIGIMSKTVEDQDESPPVGTPFADTPPLYGYPSVNGFTDIAGRPFMWHDSIVTTAVDGIGTNRVARVENLNFSYKNNVSTKRYLVDNDGQEPQEYLTGRPDFGFGMDFVPAGHLASHTGSHTYIDGAQTVRESIYDVLDNQNYVDITVKLRKKSAPNTYSTPEDSIQFDFYDAILTEAPHPWRLDGKEVVVPCVVEPRLVEVTVKDAIAQYVTGG